MPCPLQSSSPPHPLFCTPALSFPGFGWGWDGGPGGRVGLLHREKHSDETVNYFIKNLK